MDKDELFGFAMYLIVVFAICAVLGLSLAAITADHQIQSYYVGPAANNTACAYASENWNNDSVAYCSDDAGKVLDFVARANAALKGK
jgi:hypothetical protein